MSIRHLLSKSIFHDDEKHNTRFKRMADRCGVLPSMIINEVSKNKKLFGTESRFLEFLEEIWTLTEFWSFLDVLGCTRIGA